MFHRVKSFAEAHSKKANCFTVGVIQITVDPVLNWQESIGTVSTFFHLLLPLFVFYFYLS